MSGEKKLLRGPKAARRSPARRILIGLGVLVFWLGVWALLARRVGLTLLLPGPGSVLAAWRDLAKTPVFWKTVGLSLLRVLGGFAAGTVLGIALAVLTCSLPPADVLLSPVIRMIRATPVASFILLAVLWVKSGILPGFIAGLMVLPVVWAGTAAGIVSTDAQLLELARCYRFGRFKTVRLVYIPSLLPHLRTAAATGLGLAWKSGVAAEVLCAPNLAIGRSLNDAKIYLETPQLFAWTLTVIGLSLAMELGLRRAFGRIQGGENR